jgi:hypothetical protein
LEGVRSVWQEEKIILLLKGLQNSWELEWNVLRILFPVAKEIKKL